MKNLLITTILIYSFTTLLGQVTLPFEDNFDNGNFNSAWSLHPNLIGTGGVIEVLNGAGTNGSFGVRIGKLFDAITFTTNALDLHLNLSGETDVEMTFWITDQWDESQVDDGMYFSDNGGNSFVKVLDFFPHEWCDVFYGQHPPIDVDELAINAGLELSSQFVVRFQQTGQSDFSGAGGNGDGFYLDDVSVYDPNLVYATLPFEDNFNTGVFKPSWAWNFANETSTISTGNSITNPMSFVGVVNQTGVNGTPAVLIGRICDGTFTTNALDLHLNLINQIDVNLTFWLANHWDEVQDDDGIYFSDDGGVFFTKIFNFDFTNSPNDIYEFYQLDISSLASSNSLNLTDKFVIRIQQNGQSDFSGAGGNGDGFYLDDVKVMGISTPVNSIENEETIKIFPNPTFSSISVDTEALSEKIKQVQILGISGNIVLNQKFNFNETILQLDISELPAGLYIFSMIFENGEKINEKIIKR